MEGTEFSLGEWRGVICLFAVFANGLALWCISNFLEKRYETTLALELFQTALRVNLILAGVYSGLSISADFLTPQLAAALTWFQARESVFWIVMTNGAISAGLIWRMFAIVFSQPLADIRSDPS